MRTFSRYLLESPLDELPVAVEGRHPHETENDHFVNAREAAWNMKWDTKGTPITFDSHHTYHDPDTRISTGIRMTHTNPGWTGKPDKKVGVAHVHIGISGFTDPGFQMPGAVMGKIKSGMDHVGHFINNYTPHGLHTIEYDTTDPKRDSLYKHIGEMYPHITFRNISKLIPVKRKPKKSLADSVNTNYWNTSNINKFIQESWKPEEIEIANKTARNLGAIGKKAIVPAYLRTITNKKDKILDFGAGPHAPHTRALKDEGYEDVTAYEFGANANHNHDPTALDRQYHAVAGSNVLNVAPNEECFLETLRLMHSRVAPGGHLVVNLPLSPRKSPEVHPKMLETHLNRLFATVRRVGGTKKAPLFHATGPK